MGTVLFINSLATWSNNPSEVNFAVFIMTNINGMSWVIKWHREKERLMKKSEGNNGWMKNAQALVFAHLYELHVDETGYSDFEYCEMFTILKC